MNECREAYDKWITENPDFGDGTADDLFELWQAAWNYKEKSDEAQLG